MIPTDMSEIFGNSLAVTYRFLKVASKHKYIAKKGAAFYMNPRFAMNGDGVDPLLASLFPLYDILSEFDGFVIHDTKPCTTLETVESYIA